MDLRIPTAASCGALIAAMFAGTTAQATNLVTNGGFETGDFTGWTAPVDPYDGVDVLAPQAGNYAAFLGNPFGTSTISQALATVAGQTYELTFWLQNEADVNGVSSPNSFAAAWNGGPALLSLTDAPMFGYTKYDYLVTATGALTGLSFTAFQSAAFWDLDTISVSAVPEPGSLALMGMGLAMVVARRRKTTSRVAG